MRPTLVVITADWLLGPTALWENLRFATTGRRRGSAEIEWEQLALLLNLATTRFLRTVQPCGLLPNQTLQGRR